MLGRLVVAVIPYVAACAAASVYRSPTVGYEISPPGAYLFPREQQSHLDKTIVGPIDMATTDWPASRQGAAEGYGVLGVRLRGAISLDPAFELNDLLQGATAATAAWGAVSTTTLTAPEQGVEWVIQGSRGPLAGRRVYLRVYVQAHGLYYVWAAVDEAYADQSWFVQRRSHFFDSFKLMPVAPPPQGGAVASQDTQRASQLTRALLEHWAP
jgi:hypothetical protein